MSLHPIFLISSGVSQALQLLAGLSILVALHEFGHFFFARLFKTRVEKFYLFFDFLFPFSGLLNFSLFKKKVGDTEYGIGWFPLGGYVKISGMVDESMDKEALALPPQPWEYRSKKAYQRLLIMMGGIIMNVLVALGLYMLIFSVWGEEYLPMKNASYGIAVDSIGKSIGLQNGDQIKAIDDKPIERFNDIQLALIFHKEKGTITVNRNGKDTVLGIPFGTINKIIKARKGNVIALRMPCVIDTVLPNTAAMKLGLQHNDSIVGMNDQPIAYFNEFEAFKIAHKGQPVTIQLIRNNAPLTLSGTLPSDGKLGFMAKSADQYFHFEKIKYNPWTAMVRGFSFTVERFKLYVGQFKLLASKEVNVNESMGGFYSMGKMYTPEFTWYDFLMRTAFISVALAFMNFLPIPGLDGGYVIFLLWELITGRKVSEAIMEKATNVGLIILLALMVYVNGLDILRILHINI